MGEFVLYVSRMSRRVRYGLPAAALNISPLHTRMIHGGFLELITVVLMYFAIYQTAW